MKKKILFIAAILSAFALASCSRNVVNPTTTTETTTGKYRGTVDNTIEDVDIPEALREKDTNSSGGYTVKHLLENSSGSYDLVAIEEISGDVGTKTNAKANEYKGYKAEAFEQKDIEANGTIIEIKYKAEKYLLTIQDIQSEIGTISGSGEFYAFDNRATLTAKPNLGYQFLGWYNGSTLLSKDKTYSFNVEDNLNIVGSFGVIPDFSYFEFVSDQSSCVITGLKEGHPLELVVPEGVTKIADEAFKGALINSVVLPTTLAEIGYAAFSNSKVLCLTLNSTPIIGDLAFSNCIKLYEIYNNSDYTIQKGKYNYGYIGKYAEVIHGSNDEPSIIVKNDDFLFTVTENTPVLVAYNGTDTDITLPSTVKADCETYTSYSVGKNALNSNTDLEVLLIPESVTEIGDNAFDGCENLLEIYNLSDDVYIAAGQDDTPGNVGYYAKVVHESLDEPRCVFRTEDMIYYLVDDGNGGKRAMISSINVNSKNILINQIDNYPTGLDKNLFASNELIEDVILGDGIEYIGENAFVACDNLKSITANDVVYIDKGAFQNCYNLTDVTINKCQYISDYAFCSCFKLKNIDMPLMEGIGEGTFQYCNSLVSITLPETLEYIDEGAFEYCFNLISITLPETLEYIGDSAFKYCIKLRYVINKSTYLSVSAGDYYNGYVGYYASKVDTVVPEEDFYDTTNDYITYLDDSDKKHLIAYIGDSKDLVVPADVDTIDEGAFAYGDYKSISISEDTGLNDSIFFQCKNLEYLDMPCYYDLYYLFKGFTSGQITNIPKTIKTLRLSGLMYEAYSDYFENFENVETLVLACQFSDCYNQYYKLTNLKNLCYEGTIEDWCQLSFDEASCSPMYKASNFYMLDEENGNLTIGKYKYSILEDLTIPATVTDLNNYQFYGFSIKSLTIPATVTYIANNVFANCSNLTSVTYNKLTNIYTGMFRNCSSLVEFTIPKTVEVIEPYAFSYCTSLKTINLDNTLTDIQEYAFNGCSSLTKVVIPDSITTISDYLFANCYGLQKVDFAGDIISIGERAFQNCYTLNDMVLPASVTSIGVAAFRNCETMREFSFTDLGITEVSSYLFAGCRNLTTVEFSDNITEVGDHAFDNCNKIGLTKYKGALYFGSDTAPYKWLIRAEKTATIVEVNENCEIILESAFSSSLALKSLTIPNSITKLGQILNGNSTIEYLEIPFIGDGGSNSTLNYMFGSTSTYNNKVSNTLTTLKINGNITEIPMNAFINCTSLESVIIPDSVTAIGEAAFKYSGITSFDFKNVETIGYGAFYGSSIESITISDKVTSIVQNAFYDCKSLKTVDMSNISNSCSIGTNLFEGCTKLDEVNLGSIKSISKEMFKNCTKLESVAIPSTITSIGQNAFECAGLTSIDLSQLADDVTISDYVFKTCKSLTAAILPNITIINSGLFYQCDNLETCNIPSTVTEIKVNAFNGTALRSLTLPSSINAEIGSLAFGNNSHLETITINCIGSSYGGSFLGGTNKIKTVIFGEGATVVASGLFNAKSSLTSVTLPSTIEEIQSSAFNNCSSLTNITIPENVSSIGDKAFFGCSKLLEVYNLSGLTITVGETDNGYAGYYALAIHDSLDDESIYEKDANGYTFIVKEGKGYLFAYDGDEKNITLPSSFTKGGVTYKAYDIYSNAFMNNTLIESVTIPGTIITIGTSTFEGCSNLKNVIIEEGVKIIEDKVFSNCYALMNLSLPDSLEAINGSTSYDGYSNLSYYTSQYGDKYLGNENNHYLVFVKPYSSSRNALIVETGCKIIAPYAVYWYYTNLSTLNLPEGLEFIGTKAFSKCSGISSITFPTTLKYIGSSAFEDCSKLQAVLLANTNVETIEYAAFKNDPTSKIATVTLPDTLKYIGGYAFYKSIITDIKIPINVKCVDDWGLYGCESLVNIEIASAGTEFGSTAFYKSTSLTNVYYDGTMDGWASMKFASEDSSPMYYAKNFYILDSTGGVGYNGNRYMPLYNVVLTEAIEEIGSYAFYNIQFNNITIPASVKKINNYAFYKSTSLQNVYYDGTVEDWISIEFNNSYSTPMCNAFNFYILDGSGTITHNEKKYSTLTEATITSNITELPQYAFYGMIDLKVVNLPNTVTEIYDYAFYNCISITNIVLPANLTRIRSYAFSNCISLASIDFPHSLTSINSGAFELCTSLTEVILPDELLDVEQKVFSKCYNLRTITIQEFTNSFYDDAFSDCYALQDVYYNGTINDWCKVNINNSTATPMCFADNFYILDVEGTTTHNGNNYELVTDLTLNGPVTIKPYLFYGFNCLNYLTFTINVSTIGSYAFANCEHLYIVKLGQSISTIGSFAFNNCYRLVEVHSYTSSNILLKPRTASSSNGNIMQYAYVNYYNNYYNDTMFNLDSNGHIISENGYIFAKFASNYGFLVDYVGDETELTLPSSFTVDSTTVSKYGIDSYAFYKNNKITKVVIPSDTLSTYNNNGTFYKQIGDYAFDYCSNLTSVTIPSGVDTSNRNYVGDHVFDDCTRLYEIYNLNTSVSLTMGSTSNSYLARYAKIIHTSTDEDSIITKDSNGFMYMYYNSKHYLIGYTGNNEDVTIPSSFEFNGNTITDFEIYDKAFREYDFIRSITIPANIKAIGTSAFYQCRGLQEINIPTEVFSLGGGTNFGNCYSLQKIKLPSGILSIGSSAFNNCTCLTEIIIPVNVKAIGQNSFYYDYKLARIFYEGTEEDWNKITINSSSGLITNTIKYYYSELEPTESGNYWHYVAGVPTIW